MRRLGPRLGVKSFNFLTPTSYLLPPTCQPSTSNCQLTTVNHHLTLPPKAGTVGHKIRHSDVANSTTPHGFPTQQFSLLLTPKSDRIS